MFMAVAMACGLAAGPQVTDSCALGWSTKPVQTEEECMVQLKYLYDQVPPGAYFVSGQCVSMGSPKPNL